MVRLQQINKDNWEECIALKPRPDQVGFIASNLYSIAQAQFLTGFSSMAIYLDQVMIGYTLFGIDPDDKNYWVYRFMIDERYQGKGYGLAAIRRVIDEVKHRQDRTAALFVGYKPENEQARRLYLRAGFKEEGMAPWGEMIAKYDFISG
jgi:diamine N-acetyltransferase